MARYRTKDEIDLAWNKIRRRITREVDTQIADVREEILNKLLSSAWTKHVESIGTGEVLQLESGYEQVVAKALEDAGVVANASPLE